MLSSNLQLTLPNDNLNLVENSRHISKGNWISVSFSQSNECKHTARGIISECVVINCFCMALIQGKKQSLVIAMIRPMFNVSTNSSKKRKRMPNSQLYLTFSIVKQVRAVFRDGRPSSAWNEINITTPGKRKISEWMHE